MAGLTRFALLAAATTAALVTTLAPGAAAGAPERQKYNVLDDGAFHVADAKVDIAPHETLWIDLNKVRDEGTSVEVRVRGRVVVMREEDSQVAMVSAKNRPLTVAVEMRAQDRGLGNSTTVTWTHWTQ
ncbi:hypothetical protein [Streptomyces umbrinus]|uniref:hypothetical protein n=1 Tax=Streptomyces umbrinus TaxID=67370 RepID=UPI0033FE6AB0